MTTNIKDGTINKTDVGTNISSNSMPADFICPPEILDEKTKNNNLVKTKIVATPRTYTKIKFNYVLSTSGSIGGSVSCEYSTGDKSGEPREIKSDELSAPKDESKVMLVSDCEASSKPVEGVDFNLCGGTGCENFCQSNLV